MTTLESAATAIQHINIVRHLLPEEGNFPNNSRLPLIVYKGAVKTTDRKIIEDLLESNAWGNVWKDGIYDFHHYHSTAHEVLIAVNGVARVQFGGPSGVTLTVDPGDVVVIPAGVAHCLIEGDENFNVIGAYPQGQSYDLKKGAANEKADAEKNIKAVPLPESDPVYGVDGPLLKNWRAENLKD
jgi:uncharacterized protein YjlB